MAVTFFIMRFFEFCLRQSLFLADNIFFLDNVFFSDECHFHIHGGINHQVSSFLCLFASCLVFQNFRYWAENNPHWYRQEPLHSPRVTVWAAIGKRGVVSPFLFDENVTGASCLRLLQERIFPALRKNLGYYNILYWILFSMFYAKKILSARKSDWRKQNSKKRIIKKVTAILKKAKFLNNPVKPKSKARVSKFSIVQSDI